MTYSYAMVYRRGIIRRLTLTEMPLFGRHLLRLNGECRRARFGNEVANAFLKDYAQRVDASNTDVIGYLENGEVRALRSCARSQPRGSRTPRWRSRWSLRGGARELVQR
jgi:hypothetical protein